MMMNYADRAKAVARHMDRWMARNQEGWEMDQLMDAGEFSGPAQGRMEDKERRRMCTKLKVTVWAAQDAEYELAYEGWTPEQLRSLKSLALNDEARRAKVMSSAMFGTPIPGEVSYRALRRSVVRQHPGLMIVPREGMSVSIDGEGNVHSFR